MGIIKQKQSKNRRKTKTHAKTAQSARTTRRTTIRPSTTGRAPHHGQPVLATVSAGLAAPRTLHFDLFWTSVWAAEPSCIGPILQLCLIYMV